MVKRFVITIVLLAAVAIVFIFGGDINLPFLEGTTTTPSSTEEASSTADIATLVDVTATATSLPTSTTQPATEPAITDTPAFTPTVEVTPTSTSTSTITVTPTATESPFTDLFVIQAGSPVFTTNFAHPEAGCAWQGVAGQVLSKSGQAMTAYILKITGTYNGTPINLFTLTGLMTTYGPGSYEFVLGNTSIASTGQLYLQLFDPSGEEVMAPISINTAGTCAQNLQIINFQQK